MRIRFAFAPFWTFCSWLMAVGAAFSLYCFIVCQAAADPAAWQHHGIYHLRATPDQSPVTNHTPITPRPSSVLQPTENRINQLQFIWFFLRKSILQNVRKCVSG